jgi:protein SFI1
MSFIPPRASTPPHTYPTTSAVSDVSRSSALSIAELAALTPDEIEFLDAVIGRAPASATTFIHIFKAYNHVISERGLDAENEVDYYKKLLKIGTLKGENWASKWRAVKAQNGYTPTSMPARTKPPPHKTTPQVHLPSSKAASVTPPAQSSTARLLQRLKALQHETLPDPSESVPDDLLSRTDITDTETDSPPRAAPTPTPGRPSSKFTTTDNTLGLDVGANPGYPPSSTLAPSKPIGWRWFDRDPDIDKSVPFLTSTPPLSPHKPTARPTPTPASARKPISHHVPTNPTPYRSLVDLHTPKPRTADEDNAWSKVRVEQDERTADRYRNTRLLQRSFDVWKQGYDWVIVRRSYLISVSTRQHLAKPNPNHHLPPTSRRQQQLKYPMRVIHLCSASPFTSGALLWYGGVSEWRRPIPAQVHISRRRRLSAGKCTCRRGGRQRGVPICVCACRQYEVCAMVRCAGTHGRAGVNYTRVVLCSNASPYAS